MGGPWLHAAVVELGRVALRWLDVLDADGRTACREFGAVDRTQLLSGHRARSTLVAGCSAPGRSRWLLLELNARRSRCSCSTRRRRRRSVAPRSAPAIAIALQLLERDVGDAGARSPRSRARPRGWCAISMPHDRPLQLLERDAGDAEREHLDRALPCGCSSSMPGDAEPRTSGPSATPIAIAGVELGQDRALQSACSAAKTPTSRTSTPPASRASSLGSVGNVPRESRSELHRQSSHRHVHRRCR